MSGSFEIIKKTIQILEINYKYKNAYNLLCEPKLNNYNLRAPISFKTSYKYDKILLNILFFANGKRDLIELASKIKADIFVVEDIVKKLLKAGLLKKIN